MGTSITASGHSLWLLPPEPQRTRLATLMQDLARAHDAPIFPPHITLLGQLPDRDPLETTATLASRLVPMTLTLGAYGHEQVATRWLYRYVNPTHELTWAHAAALGSFPHAPFTQFTPHLSLLYGEFDAARRDAIMAAHPVSDEVFTSSRLELWKTEGPVEDWQGIGSFPLTG